MLGGEDFDDEELLSHPTTAMKPSRCVRVGGMYSLLHTLIISYFISVLDGGVIRICLTALIESSRVESSRVFIAPFTVIALTLEYNNKNDYFSRLTP